MTRPVSDDCQEMAPYMCGYDEERLEVCPGAGMEQPDLDFGTNATFDMEYREEISDYWELCYVEHRKRKKIKKSKAKSCILEDEELQSLMDIEEC